MRNQELTGFAVVCGVLAGVFIAVPGAVEAVTGETALTSAVLALSPALATPLLAALHLRQAARSGPFGRLAYAVNLLGLGLYGGAAFTLNAALFYLDEPVLKDLLAGPTRPMLLASAAAFAIGCVLFGISMARTGVHAKAPAIGYAVFPALLAALAPLPDTLVANVVHVLVGASMVWLAVGLGGGGSGARGQGVGDEGDLAVHR